MASGDEALRLVAGWADEAATWAAERLAEKEEDVGGPPDPDDDLFVSVDEMRRLQSGLARLAAWLECVKAA